MSWGGRLSGGGRLPWGGRVSWGGRLSSAPLLVSWPRLCPTPSLTLLTDVLLSNVCFDFLLFKEKLSNKDLSLKASDNCVENDTAFLVLGVFFSLLNFQLNFSVTSTFTFKMLLTV